jgi:thioredoxin-like negative regulator of GroEL
MVLMLAWLGSAVAAPGFLARRALRHGQTAMERRNFAAARRHLERAARYEPLREEAVCLMAEASLQDRRASDALYALNTLLLEQDQFVRGGLNSNAGARARSARVRLLRGIAGCVLGRSMAARRELAGISKSEATVDELLAAAQACVMSNDSGGAQHLLDQLESQGVGGELAARVHLCRAALYYRLSAWEKCLEALPLEKECSPADALVCGRVRSQVQARVPAPAKN